MPGEGFNPQPLRRGAATRVRVPCSSVPTVFQSSAPPKRGCNVTRDKKTLTVDVPILSLRCNGADILLAGAEPRVSILSPSEEGLQRPSSLLTHTRVSCFNPQPLRRGAATTAPAGDIFAVSPVSILSPSEEGLQLGGVGCASRPGCFNPQPLRRGAATPLLGVVDAVPCVSILSPSEEGCNLRCCCPLASRPLFNPQPLRRGLQLGDMQAVDQFRTFQSSAPPKRAATGGNGMRGSLGSVSILSPSEEGCNRRQKVSSQQPRSFESSAPPKRGPQHASDAPASNSMVLFQSSAPPKRGCNPRRVPRRRVRGHVSILSPSEEGLQRHDPPRHRPTHLGFNPQPLRRGAATRAVWPWSP